jgi:hypothetical protein
MFLPVPLTGSDILLQIPILNIKRHNPKSHNKVGKNQILLTHNEVEEKNNYKKADTEKLYE